jgi:hypothetical protein
MVSYHWRSCLGLAVSGCLLLAFLGTSCDREKAQKRVTIVDGVEVVANPAVPLHKDPGRVLEIREKLRIRDTGDRFYLKWPSSPAIGPDGSIFLMDRDQLLRFSPEGTFLGNLVKLGQGPDEIESLNRYLLEEGTVFVADGRTNKVVHMAVDGRYLDDWRSQDYFETMTRGWIVGSLVNLPKVTGVLADATYHFYCTSRSDPAIRKTYAFQGQFYRNPPVMMRWDFLTWVPGAGRDLLFISLSRDYEIKVLDLAAGRVIRSFGRAYPKVPFNPPENMKAVYARGGTPKPDFERDILELFLPGDALWVRTSTVDPQKGQLFDVFSAEGDFLDSFFVPVQDKILGVADDVIFVQETAEDGTISVVLYRNLERAGLPAPGKRP